MFIIAQGKMSAVERDIKRIVVFFEGVSLWKRGKKRERGRHAANTIQAVAN